MAEAAVVVGESRTDRGSQAARRLRRAGRIPAVVYGHKEETLALTIDRHEIEKVIRHGQRVVNLHAGGKQETALIRDAQWDHLGIHLLHVDFARVTADERIVVTVPIELRGIAPGVTGGGQMDQPLHTLSVECLAIAIPESIRVSIAEMQIGSIIHVRELTMPEGVKAMADPDAIVVQVKQPVAEPEAGAAVEGGTAEPEVIGRQKAAEEEEGE